jgi:proline racemase
MTGEALARKSRSVLLARFAGAIAVRVALGLVAMRAIRVRLGMATPIGRALATLLCRQGVSALRLLRSVPTRRLADILSARDLTRVVSARR